MAFRAASALILACLLSCSDVAPGAASEDVSAPVGGAAPPHDRPQLVVAANHPLAWSARRLAAPGTQVELLVPADEDPGYWSPDEAAVARMQQASLVLLVGAGHEPWAATAPLPASRLVDTTAGQEARLISLASGPSHAHGMRGEHSHGATAFSVWLDPTLWAAQVEVVAEALARLTPEDRAGVAARAASLAAELAALDVCLELITGDAAQRPLLASHPVYQYLVARYGLDLRSLHWEPDQQPDEQGWAELTALLAERPAAAMLWEAEPLPAVRARLEALGVACEVYAPGGNQTPGGNDLMQLMHANAAALERALSR